MVGYGAILVGMSVFNFIFSVVFVFGAMRAASSIHNQLLQSVMRTPISFFDKTSTGRIINRFSRDTDLIDKEVPFLMSMNLLDIAALALMVVVRCLPSAYFILHRGSRRAPRLWGLTVVSLAGPSVEVRRLQSVSRSPVFSHFGETVAGAVSIRAFGATEAVRKNPLTRFLDDNINCYVHSAALDACLIIAVQVVILLLSIGASLVSVAAKDFLEANMAGLTLTYTMQLAEHVSYAVMMLVMLEASMVAVERAMDYFDFTGRGTLEKSGDGTRGRMALSG
uniref:Putative sulfonylurea receptor n=1 Tax=Ixodes ricinus TaxID=34613 RepID=A0A090X8W7_IXORI